MNHDAGNDDRVWEKFWNEQKGISVWDSFADVIFHAILEHIGDPQGKRILEIGSGTGKICLRLSQMGAKVTMLDFSPQALMVSQNLASRLDVMGEWIRGSAYSLPLKEKSFDLAFSSGVWEHFSKEGQQVGFDNMLRSVKPGGIVLLVTPYRKNIIYNCNRLLSMRLGCWKYGYEEPLDDKDFHQFSILPSQVYSAGFFNNLHSFYIPPFDRLGVLISAVIRRLIGRERFYWWNCRRWLPGPRIFGVFEKPRV